MKQQQNSSNTSGNQPHTRLSGSSQSNMSSATSGNQIEKAYVSSNPITQTGAVVKQPQAGLILNQSQNNKQQQSASRSSSSQSSQAQAMANETGLEYTSDVIREEKLKNKNQKATDSLVDRMYWQHEESLSKSINVNDKGELENYDDTPGLGNDKPGL